MNTDRDEIIWHHHSWKLDSESLTNDFVDSDDFPMELSAWHDINLTISGMLCGSRPHHFDFEDIQVPAVEHKFVGWLLHVKVKGV